MMRIIGALVAFFFGQLGMVEGFAAGLPCDNKQVHLAVMVSARRDLPAPYNSMDVKGSSGVTPTKDGVCMMKLSMGGGNSGQEYVDVIYDPKVPLTKLKVQFVKVASNPDAPAVADAAGDKCTQIQFPKRHIATAIHGEVDPDETKCYQITTRDKQTMVVRLISRIQNSGVTIENIGDAKDHLHFPTEKKTYTIHVSQTMRSTEKDYYLLIVSVR